MHVRSLNIVDVLLFVPVRHSDERGSFSETFRQDVFQASIHDKIRFVQDNNVRSSKKGVLRGLHFQILPHAQGKLVNCTRGSIQDVCVDIRAASPTFGRHVAVVLSAAESQQLWVPPGFAHGYLTLEDECEVNYKVTDYYAPQCDRGLAWDDPELGINWQLPTEQITLSHKDRSQPKLADLTPAFRFGT
jgi:dTDP-4-dehydrorhamnose 3,5-epimerase